MTRFRFTPTHPLRKWLGPSFALHWRIRGAFGYSREEVKNMKSQYSERLKDRTIGDERLTVQACYYKKSFTNTYHLQSTIVKIDFYCDLGNKSFKFGWLHLSYLNRSATWNRHIKCVFLTTQYTKTFTDNDAKTLSSSKNIGRLVQVLRNIRHREKWSQQEKRW